MTPLDLLRTVERAIREPGFWDTPGAGAVAHFHCQIAKLAGGFKVLGSMEAPDRNPRPL